MENPDLWFDVPRIAWSLILFGCGYTMGWIRWRLLADPPKPNTRVSPPSSPQPDPSRQINDALDLLERQRIRNLLMDALEIEKAVVLPAPRTVGDLAAQSYRTGRHHGLELALHLLERLER